MEIIFNEFKFTFVKIFFYYYLLYIKKQLNCPKATKTLRGVSLLFTIKSTELPANRLFNLGRMKDLIDLGATQ